MDALVDLTGGIAERFDLDQTEDMKLIYTYIAKASRHGAFITASRKVGIRNNIDNTYDNVAL